MGPSGEPRFERVTVVNGVVELPEGRFALAWSGSGEPLEPSADAQRLAPLDRVAVSGDLSYAGGHLLPTKAPATHWLAVPAYFVLFHGESLFGLDPDAWWMVTLNAWLSSAGSVGLLAAFGVALFFRVARRLSGASLRSALLATLAFAFGTPFFPYATALFDNDVTAVALLAAFGWGFAALRAPAGVQRAGLVGAGALAGLAVTSSYAAGLVLPLFAAYALWGGGLRGLTSFAAGASLPLALLAWHHIATLGTPFATPYGFDDPMFREGEALLGVFDGPRPGRLLAILLSPYRGIFVAAPVLLLALGGWLAMWRLPERRVEFVLFAALVGSFLLFNASFNGWHGGWGYAPRYLIPVLPFLALPLVFAAQQRPAWVGAFTALSIVVTGLFTAVDPQTPVGTSPIATQSHRPGWQHSPLLEYALPIFVAGRAGPLLPAQGPLSDPAPTLAYFEGPVSANPIGIYEAWLGQSFAVPGPLASWNAFNVGELWLPGRRASLLVPGLAIAFAVGGAWRAATPGTKRPARAGPPTAR